MEICWSAWKAADVVNRLRVEASAEVVDIWIVIGVDSGRIRRSIVVGLLFDPANAITVVCQP